MILEEVYYGDTESFCEMFLDTWTDVDGGINIVGDYYEIVDIMSELSLYDDILLYDIVLRNPDINSYDKEYILTLDEYGKLYVYPAFNGKYVEVNDFTYVFEDVNSKFLVENDNIHMYMITFEECDGDCEHCHLHDDEDDQLAVYESSNGISQSWAKNGNYFSRSFYSSDEEEMERIKTEWQRFAQMF